jgi:hypothetical protein
MATGQLRRVRGRLRRRQRKGLDEFGPGTNARGCCCGRGTRTRRWPDSSGARRQGSGARPTCRPPRSPQAPPVAAVVWLAPRQPNRGGPARHRTAACGDRRTLANVSRAYRALDARRLVVWPGADAALCRGSSRRSNTGALVRRLRHAGPVPLGPSPRVRSRSLPPRERATLRAPPQRGRSFSPARRSLITGVPRRRSAGTASLELEQLLLGGRCMPFSLILSQIFLGADRIGALWGSRSRDHRQRPSTG